MKRITCLGFIVIIVTFLGICVNAKEYTATSEDEYTTFEYEAYLPEAVKEIIINNYGQAPNEIEINELISLCINYLKIAVNNYIPFINEILLILIIASILTKINDNTHHIMIIRYVIAITICFAVLRLLGGVYGETKEALVKNQEMLTAILPSFVTVLALNSSVFLSASLSASVTAIISFLQSVLSTLGLTLAMLCAVFVVIEKISPVFEEINCVKHLKKYTITLITFITTVLMTVLTYQNLISARADSLSTRSVKFVAANFIPIIGNAVGESLRTVSTGVSYLRASIGGAVSLSLFFVIFPFIAKLIILKLLLSLLAFIGSVLGVKDSAAVISGFIEAVDIFLIIIICSGILSFFVISVFSLGLFGG